MKRKIISSAKRVFSTCKRGDIVDCYINGKVVASYEFLNDYDTEYCEPDAKTPLDWVNGVFCWEIRMRGLENPIVAFKKR